MNKNEWKKVRLGEVATYINGFAFKPADWGTEGMPIIRIQNLTNPNAEFNRTLKEVPEKYIVRKGDILVSWSATLGVFQWESEDALLNQHIFKVVFDKKDVEIAKDYFKFVMAHVIQEMRTKVHGITLQHIVKSDFDNTRIPLPPLSVQREIVSELDLLSTIITKKRAQLDELDRLAAATFHQTFGDPIENPKQWPTKTVGDFASSVCYGTSKAAKEGGKYKYLRMGNIDDLGYLDLSDLKYIDIDDCYYEKYVVRRGDILFNRTNSREKVGKTALFDLDEEMIIAGYIIRLRLKEEILPVFFARYMNMPFMKDYLRNLCRGIVGQANINSKELQAIPLIVPPFSLQQAFASKISSIEKQKELIKKSVAEVQTLLDATMDKWFS